MIGPNSIVEHTKVHHFTESISIFKFNLFQAQGKEDHKDLLLVVRLLPGVLHALGSGDLC